MTEQNRPPLRFRVLVAFGVAVAVTILFLLGFAPPTQGDARSDFDQVWAAARMLTRGQDPYAMIGPGRAFDWPWPFYYPLTTAVAVIPLTMLPLAVARVIFIAISAGLLTFALTRENWERLAVLGSASALLGLLAGQWSPLLTGAVLLPSLAWFLALKPTVGLALVAASLSRWVALRAGIAGLVLITAAFLLMPGWLGAWRTAVATGEHFRILLLRPPGPLLLLSVLRWRHFEGRLLLALACVPQTPVVYEALPLFLIPQSRRPMIALILLSAIELIVQAGWNHNLRGAVAADRAADLMLWFLYLPTLILVLCRPVHPKIVIGNQSREHS